MTDAATRASTLSERLDRLPFTRMHLRVLTGSPSASAMRIAMLTTGSIASRCSFMRFSRVGPPTYSMTM